jgi:hypothetical protein
MASNVVKLNSVLNDTLSYLEDNKASIINIIALIEHKDGFVEYHSTPTDLNLLFLLHRKVQEELNLISALQYPSTENAFLEAGE